MKNLQSLAANAYAETQKQGKKAAKTLLREKMLPPFAIELIVRFVKPLLTECCPWCRTFWHKFRKHTPWLAESKHYPQRCFPCPHSHLDLSGYEDGLELTQHFPEFVGDQLDIIHHLYEIEKGFKWPFTEN